VEGSFNGAAFRVPADVVEPAEEIAHLTNRILGHLVVGKMGVVTAEVLEEMEEP
jgi:hypothetical protein